MLQTLAPLPVFKMGKVRLTSARCGTSSLESLPRSEIGDQCSRLGPTVLQRSVGIQ